MNAGKRQSRGPVLILAPIGSKGSLLAAALGRHPDLFAAPHLSLLAFENLRQFIRFAKVPHDVHIHGLVRMVSWLLVAEQSVEATQAARRWLGRHASAQASIVHRMIASSLHSKRLVEYSPLYVYHRRVLERVVAAAPNAMFIHLVRHPSATAMEIARAAVQTLDAALDRWTKQDPNQACLDIVELTDTAIDWQADPPVFDPQFLWFRAHTAIAEVLAGLPRRRVMRVRAEDLVTEPEATLTSICRRLRLPVTPDLLGEMLRTEEDTFARPGPFGAAGGVDWDFVTDPTFPRPDALAPTEGSLPWRGDGRGYCPEVIDLAEQLGYRSTGGLAPPVAQLTIPAVAPSPGYAAD